MKHDLSPEIFRKRLAALAGLHAPDDNQLVEAIARAAHKPAPGSGSLEARLALMFDMSPRAARDDMLLAAAHELARRPTSAGSPAAHSPERPASSPARPAERQHHMPTEISAAEVESAEALINQAIREGRLEAKDTGRWTDLAKRYGVDAVRAGLQRLSVMPRPAPVPEKPAPRAEAMPREERLPTFKFSASELDEAGASPCRERRFEDRVVTLTAEEAKVARLMHLDPKQVAREKAVRESHAQ